MRYYTAYKIRLRFEERIQFGNAINCFIDFVKALQKARRDILFGTRILPNDKSMAKNLNRNIYKIIGLKQKK